MSVGKFTWSVSTFFILAGNLFAEDSIKISSGNTVGTYYATSSAVAKISNKDRSDTEKNIITMPSGGSLDNINNVVQGKSNFGLVQAETIDNAIKGKGKWEGKPQKKLKAVLKLYTEDLTIVVDGDQDIESIADLKGKRVNVGGSGSSGKMNFRKILLMAGIQPSDVTLIEKPQSNSQDLMKKGDIDAYVFTVGHPAIAVRDTSANQENIKILELDQALIEVLLKQNSLIKSRSIPIDYYPDLENKVAVPTVGVHTILFTTADESDETVYRIVKSVMKNLDLFKRQHPTLQNLDAKTMSDISFMSVHPGAQRYFKEAGLAK
jgi:uncharacterized protein